MQLQRVLCYSYTYGMTFMAQSLKSHINYIQPRGQPPPQIKKSGCPPDRIGDEMFIDLTGNVLACREAQLVKTCNEFHTAQNKEPLS